MKILSIDLSIYGLFNDTVIYKEYNEWWDGR